MAENRKNEIVKISAKLFKEKGYTAVTMRDIAEALDIKAASLYNHIQSKQEILNIVVLSVAEEFTKGMNTIKNNNLGTLEQLNQIIHLHIKITIDHQNGMASLNNDWMHLGDQCDYYLKMRTDYEENFRQIIITGIKNGELINENVEIILFSILSTLRSLYLWLPKKESIDPQKLYSILSKVLLNGIVR